MKVALFEFEVPRELIAARPAMPRDSARLLVVAEPPRDRVVRDLPDLLAPGDILVFNETKVIPARLGGSLSGRATGGRVEMTLLRQLGRDGWQALAKPARKLRVGSKIAIADGFEARVAAKPAGGEVGLRFNLAGAALRVALARHGRAPLPPYIPRAEGPDGRDRRDYQTVFARHEGAVAAPTAGLHFTARLLDRLTARGIGRAMVTLHVGAGTFLPVKVEDTADHHMHSEWGRIDAAAAATINRARAAGGQVVAVGTTSLRLLESAADYSGRIASFEGETSLFITPGYRVKAVDALVTNFHLPRSTLFMLVAAFAGLERMKHAYAHAVAARYRFYSYGDACLLRRARG